MSWLRRPFRSESGFSLIEVLAAISVFAVITLGITPLLVSSLRGSTLSRSLTRSKNLVQEAMERIRGLPYFDTGVNRDVIDIYFPGLGAGYDAGTGTFTTTCTPTSSTPAPSGALACPPLLSDGTSRIPAGHTMTFVAEFVVPTGAGPETFAVKTPPVGYTSSDPALAVPPAQLMRMTITLSWTQIGRPRQVRLVSLIGDRKLSPDKARANASVDFVVEAQTAFKRESDGRLTQLTALAGKAISDVELRYLASAGVEAKAGEIALTSQDSPNEAGTRLDTVSGATSQRTTAPPTQAALSVITDTDADTTIVHPDLLVSPDVAFLADGSSVNQTGVTPPPSVQVIDNLPRAVTTFTLNPASDELSLWLENQADLSSGARMRLNASRHQLELSKLLGRRLSGRTFAEATAVLPSASRKVEATATSEFGQLELFPTTFASEGVVAIEDFTASIQCRSTGTLGTGIATGSWSATFKYWHDPNNDGIQEGSYISLPISGSTTSTATDVFADLRTTNPLIADSVLLEDMHLFETATQAGYLTELDAAELIGSTLENVRASVSMEQAISLVTAETDADNEETQLTVNIGKMSCEARDNRG